MIGGYKIQDPHGIHFLTFTVVEWVDAFTRPVYKDMLIENFEFYHKKRGWVIYAFVIMSNHIHMIVSSPQEPLSDIIRDYKRWTSRRMKEMIQAEPESRRKWMLKLFKEVGIANPVNDQWQLWQQYNHPEVIYSLPFGIQKLTYIHQNPVKARIVVRPEDYVYSSAANYAGEPGIMKVRLLDEW